MQYYFNLQYTRLKRKLKTLGINPLLGLLSAILLFVIASKLLFLKTEYASWIYLGIMASILMSLSQGLRNYDLRKIFSSSTYIKLRLIENSLFALPFFFYLMYEAEFVLALLIIPLLGLFAFYRSRRWFNYALPTPFKKFPFEFITGFRKSFWFLVLIYFLVAKALHVGNYYLSLFGMAMVFFTGMYYYVKPEKLYFVWIHNTKAKQFLKKKFLISIVCMSLLVMVPMVAILFSFPEEWMTTVFVYILGYVFLGSMIIAKYSAYPMEMNVPQAIFYGLSLSFPIFLPMAIWVFYSQSKKQLERIL